MITYQTTLRKFGEKGEKTGWTYAEIPGDIAQEIKPNTKVGFRVKGAIDAFPLKLVALIPMGEGEVCASHQRHYAERNSERRRGNGYAKFGRRHRRITPIRRIDDLPRR